MPGSINQLITFVYSSDLDRSHEFYAEVLGLTMSMDQGACRIYRVTSSSAIGVCSHRPPSPAGMIITLVTDDVDDWHARLVGAGITTDGPPRRNEDFGIYHFSTTDPDGNAIEIQRFEQSFQPDLPEDEVGWFA